MNTRRLQTYTFLTLLSLPGVILSACGEKDPNQQEDNANVAVTTAKAPTCADTPAPERCATTTPTYGRATLLTEMSIAKDTSINVAGLTLTNGLYNLTQAAKQNAISQGKNANEADMSEMLKKAIKDGKINIVIEVPGWAKDTDTQPDGKQTLYLWLGTQTTDSSITDITIDPISADKGSYPKGVVADILFEKPGTAIKVKTSAPQSTHMNMSFAGMNLPIDIEGATLTGTVIPRDEGLELKHASITGGISVNSFKKGILEIVKKCGNECYTVNESNLSCAIKNDPNAASNSCVTHLQGEDEKLRNACQKIKDFCSDKAKLGIDLFSSNKQKINGEKVLGAKFQLEGKPIKISGIAPTSSF